MTAAEVTDRVARGAVNTAARGTSRTLRQILRANLLTRFNALIGTLAGLVLVFGHPLDALFGLVVLVNSAVGVIQEVRAKRALDRLALLAAAPVRVRRDGGETHVPPQEVVVDDVVLLGPGENVPVDGEVLDAHGLDVDESLLTGEADPVAKGPGDQVRSGTFVAAGNGSLRATGVGGQSYAARLAAEAGRFDLTHSELMSGINRFLRLITWIIVPVGGLLTIRLFTRGTSVPAALVGSVAGVVPMVPEGLVLMTSVAFALGVIRLSRHRCLVQELPAVEVLARVDTLCVDKTGTLTEPGMAVRQVRPLAGTPVREAEAALAALARTDPNPNPTMRALAACLPDSGWQARESIEFSSALKYSGADFGERSRWLVGAPEVLLPQGDPAREEADRLAGSGFRVLALVRTTALPVGDGHTVGADRQAAALVLLEQRLRPDAPETMRYFAEQGVEVKVLSGDNPTTVGEIARQAGVPAADRPVDARSLPDDPDRLARAVSEHAVFGRVTPRQKRAVIAALHARGRTVAMTGDGVNDALALTDADLGIAMGSGSPATRTVAKVVLLGDNFTAMPRVLAEGRRVLANIERVAKIFLTKTVYSVVLAVLVAVTQLPFPFLPRQVTLIGTLTIGVPGFFLALAPCAERARAGFVRRVLRFAVPCGLVCGVATFVAYLLARSNRASDLAADRSTATLTLFLVAFCVLALVARPYASWRGVLLSAVAAAFAVVALVPGSRHLAALTFPEPRDYLAGMGLAAGGGVVLAVLARLTATSARARR